MLEAKLLLVEHCGILKVTVIVLWVPYSTTKPTNIKCKISRKQKTNPSQNKTKINHTNKKHKQKEILSVFFVGFFFNIISSLIFPGVRLAADSQFSDFLDGLGPAQLVGRQTLATPSMGKRLCLLHMISILSGN